MKLIKPKDSEANKVCANCKHFDNAGYINHQQTKNLGFCSRFCETTGAKEANCKAFIPNDKVEQFYRNVAKAEKLGIKGNLDQLELFQTNIF